MFVMQKKGPDDFFIVSFEGMLSSSLCLFLKIIPVSWINNTKDSKNMKCNLPWMRRCLHCRANAVDFLYQIKPLYHPLFLFRFNNTSGLAMCFPSVIYASRRSIRYRASTGGDCGAAELKRCRQNRKKQMGLIDRKSWRIAISVILCLYFTKPLVLCV